MARREAAPVTAVAAHAPTVQAAPPTHPVAAQAPAPPPQYQAPAPPPPPAYDTSPTRALPARRRGRGLAVGVAAALLGAGLLAGGLFAAGVFESDTTKPVTKTTTVGRQSTDSASTDAGSDSGKTVTPASDYTSYSTDSYRAEYPADWRIAEDHVLKTTYSRTRFVAPEGSEVWIDHSPGQNASPEASATQVETATARTSGYRRLSFESTTLNGRDAFEWTFQLGSERRIDIFLTAGGDGFAVLGKGSDSESVLGVARHVAGSIQPSSSP